MPATTNAKCNFNEGSNFDRKGQFVIGTYLGMYPQAHAVVSFTRVMLGGRIKHVCKLAQELRTEYVHYHEGDMIGLMEEDLSAAFHVVDVESVVETVVNAKE